MLQGKISKLVHLSTQTEYPAAKLITSHNSRGYGHIEAEVADDEIYFEPAELTNCRFTDLSEGDQVEYELDPKAESRAKSVVVLNWSDDEGPNSHDKR